MTPQRRSRLMLLGAYAATWIIWGSTYLAIRVAVQSVPPFLLVGVRSLTAGAILCAWARLRGEPLPSRGQWLAALLTGTLFFLVGHGGLFWAEQRVASGPAALMIATEHFWIVLLPWLFGGPRASGRALAGIALGLAGVGALTLGTGGGRMDPTGTVVLLVASAAWSVGTLYYRPPRKPASPLFAAGAPLITGGVLLFPTSLVSGELRGFHLADATPNALLALAYLIVFGSVVAFTAYSWLVEREGPGRALSFTYVNPLVAVLLGWAVLGEQLTIRIVIAGLAIVAAVVLIINGIAAESSSPRTASVDTEDGADPSRIPHPKRRVARMR